MDLKGKIQGAVVRVLEENGEQLVRIAVEIVSETVRVRVVKAAKGQGPKYKYLNRPLTEEDWNIILFSIPWRAGLFRILQKVQRDPNNFLREEMLEDRSGPEKLNVGFRSHGVLYRFSHTHIIPRGDSRGGPFRLHAITKKKV